MERESNQMQTLCRSGCGFYGSPATDGLCSLCYKEAVKKRQQLPTTPSGHCAALMASTTTTTSHLNPLASHATSADFDVTDNHLPANNGSRQELNNVRQERSRSSLRSRTSLASASNSKSAVAAGNGVFSGVHNVTPVASLPYVDARQSILSQNTSTIAVVCQAVDQAASNAAESNAPAVPDAIASPSMTPGVANDSENDDRDSDKDKKKKNRCAVCRKKVGLTGFQCRCGGLFCAIHRYSDKHDCSFNYREMGAQEIRRNNPVVVGEKIQKI